MSWFQLSVKVNVMFQLSVSVNAMFLFHFCTCRSPWYIDSYGFVVIILALKWLLWVRRNGLHYFIIRSLLLCSLSIVYNWYLGFNECHMWNSDRWPFRSTRVHPRFLLRSLLDLFLVFHVIPWFTASYYPFVSSNLILFMCNVL